MLASLNFIHSPEDPPASFCHRPGRGFKARLLPSSYRMLPRRRACRAHAPLFEWTNVGCLQTWQRAPLSSVPFSSSPSSSSSVCLFSCGGLGVGEKPTRGELVRSTHRVPSPFISSYDFPSRPFGEPQHPMGLAAAYGPFLPAVYHPFVLRETGRAPQKGLPEYGLSKESKISQRIIRRGGEPVQGRRPYTQPSRQPTAGGNAQSKGSSSRPRRARCC